jgi:hypothetical protein
MSVPYEVAKPWRKLLEERELLHDTLGEFAGVEAYTSARGSKKLKERQHTAALEFFVGNVFNLVVDLAKELLIANAQADRRALKRQGADQILKMADEAGMLRSEDLEEIQLGRNEGQHQYAFMAVQQAWRQITLVESSIDKIMAQLQIGFEKAGVKLDMDWPGFVGEEEVGL